MNIGIGPSLNSSLEFKLREKYSAVFLFFFSFFLLLLICNFETIFL